MTYVIKQQPEDFIVEEILDLQHDERGKYAYFLLEKRGITTEQAVQQVSRQSGMPRKLLSYAGSKDKEAVTKQYICVPASFKAKIRATFKGNIKAKIRLSLAAFGNERISLGSNTGNRFTIVVRDVDAAPDLSTLPPIPNYFDEQRFSADNAAIGKAILKQNFKLATSLLLQHDEGGYEHRAKEFLKENPANHIGALQLIPKKTLLMFVHAYQSLVWNNVVAAYLKDKCRAGGGKEVKYSQGVFFFPKERAVEMKVPLPGFDADLNTEIGRRMHAGLDKDKVALRDFVVRRLPGLTCEGDVRDMFISVKDFKATGPEDDDMNSSKKKVTLSFFLPKGSYATMVVKGLFA